MDIVSNNLFNEETKRKTSGVGTDNAQAFVVKSRGMTTYRGQRDGESSHREQYEGKYQKDLVNTIVMFSDGDVCVLSPFIGNDCLQSVDEGDEWMGNANDSKIEGIRDINIEIDIRCKVKLQDVREAIVRLFKTKVNVQKCVSSVLWQNQLDHMGEQRLQVLAGKSQIPLANEGLQVLAKISYNIFTNGRVVHRKRHVGLLTKEELEEIPSQVLITVVPRKVKFCTEALGVDSQ
ncbi:hypothetical protein EZV62_007821 [Acer yangbiense]|uniref:Uncharacterized protein n=1 Tax=Acer yangbiense TaxID=1000413 RepID=A0A5C7IDM3_9ROSI|nr:hypothetical protein EZV62_007821 [Acer yangbiense]